MRRRALRMLGSSRATSGSAASTPSRRSGSRSQPGERRRASGSSATPWRMTHSYELGDTIKRATSSHSRLIVGIAIASSLAALAPTPPHAADARITGCATSGLVVWIDTQGSGAAGSVFYKLRFTNLSGHACTLAGYPGVSAVDLRGHRLGREAAREPSQRRAVRLAKGA